MKYLNIAIKNFNEYFEIFNKENKMLELFDVSELHSFHRWLHKAFSSYINKTVPHLHIHYKVNIMNISRIHTELEYIILTFTLSIINKGKV